MGHICDSKEFSDLFKYLEFKDITIKSVQNEFISKLSDFFAVFNLKVNGVIIYKADVFNVITVSFGGEGSIVTVKQFGSELIIAR